MFIYNSVFLDSNSDSSTSSSNSESEGASTDSGSSATSSDTGSDTDSNTSRSTLCIQNIENSYNDKRILQSLNIIILNIL